MSGGNNSAADAATSSNNLSSDLSQGLSAELDSGYQTSDTTKSAQQDVIDNSYNADYANATQSALDYSNSLLSNGGLTSGQDSNIATTNDYANTYGGYASQYADLASAYEQDAPGYQRVRSDVANDVTTQSYADFNNSGLFGSDVNMSSSAEGLGSALAQLDYANYTNNINNKYASLAGQQSATGAAQGATESAFGMEQQGVDNSSAYTSQLQTLYDAIQAGAMDRLAIGGMQDEELNSDFQRYLDTLKAGGGGSDTNSDGTDWWQTILGTAAAVV